MDKDIEKVLEEFEASIKVKLDNIEIENMHERSTFDTRRKVRKEADKKIKELFTQALEAEKAKREAMAREMVGEEKLVVNEYEPVEQDFINIGNNQKRQELIKIALKYGVEV